MVGVLLAYVALVVTVTAFLGWMRERHLAQQVKILAKMHRGQNRIGESLAEVESAAMIHSVSRPGGVEETQRRRALRASQIDPDEL